MNRDQLRFPVAGPPATVVLQERPTGEIERIPGQSPGRPSPGPASCYSGLRSSRPRRSPPLPTESLSVYRIRLLVTQAVLASALGIRRGYISVLENNESILTEQFKRRYRQACSRLARDGHISARLEKMQSAPTASNRDLEQAGPPAPPQP